MDGTKFQLSDEDFKAAVVVLLAEIRDVLLHGLQAAEADEDDGACQHPEEKRISLATPINPDHWICGMCKYEHAGIVHN